MTAHHQIPAPPAEPDRAATLLAVAEAIARHADLSGLFRDLVRRLPPVVPFDFLVVLLYDADAGMMRMHLMQSRDPESIRRGPDLTPLDSPGGHVWQTQEGLVIDDYAREERFPLMRPVWQLHGFGSGCYLPLS